MSYAALKYDVSAPDSLLPAAALRRWLHGRCGQRRVGGARVVLQRGVAHVVLLILVRSNDAAQRGLMSVGGE